MDAGTEVSLLGGLSRPVAFLVLILAFLAGAWVGRGSVLLETRARRRHLDEAVGKIVAGVVEGLKATSGVPTPAPTNVAADAVTPIVRGVLAGLATPRRNADADSGAAATNDDGSASREGSGMASPSPSRPSRRLSARARARAEAAAAEQTLARAEAEASAAAAASAAGRADMSTSSAPRRDDSDSDEAEETEVISRSVPFSNDDGLVINDETTRATFASDGGVSETEDLPVEMDVDASMEDAFPPEDRDGGAAGPADASTENLFGSGSAQARTETRSPSPASPERADDPNEARPEARPEAPGPGPVPEEDDARLAESTPPARASPERSVSPAERAAVGAEPEAESPTRLAAAAAHEAQRAAEIERQRGAAKAAKKAARSERVVAQRVLSHRKGIEEAEARASEMDDARADAQRFLERAGAHALAAAGCMGATLLRLELIDAAAGRDLRSIPVNKLEGAYKKALAKNHPDRSAARGDDVAAAARCEETFKLLQAAHRRWTETGKPVGDAADARARAAYPLGAQTSSASFSSSTRAGGGAAASGSANGSPGFYASRRTQAAAAAAAAASVAAAAANGGGRSWRPGESASAGGPPAGAAGADYRDAFRERARHSAAAAADALRREEERVAAELAAERAREASRLRAEEERHAAEAERARRESAAYRAKAAEEAAERAAAVASEARRRARDENLKAAAAADAAFAAATTPREKGVSPRDGDENETVVRERSPARFKARRPPVREDLEKERIERNMDKL